MTKVAFETVGCRLNQYETEKLADELTQLGMERVEYNDEADLYILNSCTVTGRADADCRKLINRTYRKNKDAVMVVAGCYVVSERQKVAEMNGVDIVVGNDDKSELPKILQERFPHLFEQQAAEAISDDIHACREESGTWVGVRYSRPMVKIGDGCNQKCTYCIVPSVRGNLISFRSNDIIDEIKRLVDLEFHEVVLTAVHIGRYLDDGLNLAGLVEMILDKTGLSRVRLSSLEPNELDDRLLDFVANHPRVCRHLHLPLQSGSNRILKLMNRPYTRESYLEVIERAKSANQDITIGCDLIIGFPGENDEDFLESIEMFEPGWIDYSHVFSYSDRPGTPASVIPNKVHSKLIKQRNQQAREVGERNRSRQMQSQIGKTVGVISERHHDKYGVFWGVSDNYMRVKLPPSIDGVKEIINFKPIRLVDSHLEGEVKV
jgi:threonylcarbamoyladenosine tRNA methylthiotransferase MtaB